MPVESKTLLEVTDLDISFRNAAGWQPIVQGVSFSINPGELVGLVGESGSGKTVTALSLLGLLPENARVASTRTFFEGRDLRGAKESTYREIRGKGIALISQEPMVALDPAFTIGNQIVEVLRVTRSGSRSELRQHALELLRDVQLPQPETTMGSYAHQISGGMAQRVAIAFALAGNPQILIADEPTTALDVTVQAEILDLLRRLRDEHGMAVILVTHDLGVVADFCERVLVMQHGRIVERGTSDALFDSPQNAYTQALIRATPSLIELPTTQEPPESIPERKSL